MEPIQCKKTSMYLNLPHEVCQVSRRNVALASSVKSLKCCIWFKSLSLAEILSAKLDSLFTFSGVSEEFS